jgi:DNA-binding NarL/FixJ family response regulator
LICSLHHEDTYALRALRAGAAGYLSKQCAPSTLLNALHQVALGRKYISAELAQELAAQISSDLDAEPHQRLSDREYQTLLKIATGMKVTEIAAQLTLSVKTISMYRTRLLQKMRMRNNAELTHYAIRHQLLPELIE